MPDGAYETRDASAKGLALFAVGVIVMLIVIALLPIPILRHLSRSHERPYLRVDRVTAPSRPQLGPAGDADVVNARRRDAQQLRTYGWIDRRAGIVHIPIERAMQLVVEERR